jgi:single-strand DNA-binding protein
VVLAGTVSADPIQRRMPSGDEVTELRLSVPETGKRLLPLPVAAWHATVGARTVDGIAKGDAVLVHGQLVRRFYRSGAGARSLTEVVATGIKKLEHEAAAHASMNPIVPPAVVPARGHDRWRRCSA